MDALVANLPPAQRDAILEQLRRDVEEAQQAAASAAAAEAAAAAAAAAEQRVQNLRNANAITDLRKYVEAGNPTTGKLTNRTLKNKLSAAEAAVYAVDDGNTPPVSDFHAALQEQVSRMPRSSTGYASDERRLAVQGALRDFGVQVAPGVGGGGGGGGDELPEEEEVEEEEEETEEAAAAAERPQELPAADAPAVVRQAFDLIKSSPMRRDIRFDLAPFLLRVHDNVLAAQAKAGTKNDGLLTMEETIKMFGGGRTQARKTPLKTTAFILCRMMGVPTLLLTTNVAGREDLFKKFSKLLAKINVPPPALSASAPPYAGTQYEYRKVRGVWKLFAVGRGEPGPKGVSGLLSVESISGQHRAWAVSELRQGACIICNNTHSAITKVANLVLQARGDRGAPLQFILTIDEADDFYRTDGEFNAPIKLEQALLELKGLGPLVCFEVSATLLAVYMALHREGGAGTVTAADLCYVDPSSEYVGAELLMPPQNSLGEDQFLSENDLTKANKYADEKVLDLYAHAASEPKSLLLDATTPAVTAKNQVTIFDKALMVQGLHPHAILVVVSGSVIKWWTAQPRPDRQEQDGHGTERYGKEKVVDNVIAEIDKYYPRRPIFVFGYSQMVRGVSFRSTLRVPSHFVLMYKSGMPLCRLVQAAGRAMGEQATQLRANGFDHVRMLTQNHDYDVICAYPEFLKKIKDEMRDGASLAVALGRAYDAKYNVFSTPKELGAKRSMLGDFAKGKLKFKTTTEPIGPGSAAIDKDLGPDGIGPRRAILEVLHYGNCYHEELAMTGEEVREELDTGHYDDIFGDAANGAESARRKELCQTSSPNPSDAAITKLLKELCHKPVHRAPVLEQTQKYVDGTNGRSKRKIAFYINEEVFDALPGRGNVVAVPAAAAAAASAADDDNAQSEWHDMQMRFQAAPPEGAAAPSLPGPLDASARKRRRDDSAAAYRSLSASQEGEPVATVAPPGPTRTPSQTRRELERKAAEAAAAEEVDEGLQAAEAAATYRSLSAQ